MAKVPVDECPAGPAMDAAVAKALGHVTEVSQGAAFRRVSIHYNGDVTDDEHRQRYEWVIISSYSTDIAAAWESVEEMQGSSSDSWEIFSAELCDGAKLLRGKGDGDAPLFISRAFLKANGVEFVEVPDGNG